MKVNRWVLSFFFILILISTGFIIYKIFNGFEELTNAQNENLPIRYSITDEERTELKLEVSDRIKLLQIRESKVRNSVYLFEVDNTYPLIVFSEDVDSVFHLGNTHVKKGNSDRTTGVPYSIIDYKDFSFQYMAGDVGKIEGIYLAFSDNVTKTFEGDSIVSYRGSMNDLSIRYSERSPVGVYLVAGGNQFFGKKLNVYISIQKRKNKTWFYLFISTDKEPVPESVINLV